MIAVARPERDDVTPLTVEVRNDKGQLTTRLHVSGWSSANAVVAAYAKDVGKTTEVVPRTD
ncbi:MAG TPA: hypothetical protein VGS97_10460 [Actinocrinis sp.]|uniref:hypothetical protein n=1 Tax=Actinocrinis sp. TaxID=1920516 RepID=UPI002DDCE825|nr:hypothetical protein [Actinocrinis sp.]HEV2344503.1 hypothetical protein [Actinocrinis sp.]